MNPFTMGALVPALLAGILGSPAMAGPVDRASMATTERGAVLPADPTGLDTRVPSLTYGVRDNRRAAIAYLNDATRMLDQAQAQLDSANPDQRATRALLVGASGKLVAAYLHNFRDRQFAQSVRPLTLQIDEALSLLTGDPQQAAAILAPLRPQIARLTDSQLASLGGTSATSGGGGGGGGAGGPSVDVNAPGFEDLTPPAAPGMEPPVPELPAPLDNSLPQPLPDQPPAPAVPAPDRPMDDQ